MKRMHTAVYTTAVLFLATLLLVLGLLPAAAETADISILMADIDWNGLDHTYCGFESKQQLLNEVSGYADAIAELTGNENWASFYSAEGVTVEIRFTEYSSCVEGGYQSYEVKIPRIYINRTMAEYDFWPLAHELTHLICPEYSALSLREGLACYMQDTVGQNPAVFNYGLDVHAYAYLYLLAGDIDHLVLTRTRDAAPIADEAAAMEERTAFYLCSYSFSKYLIETYGIASFMELYHAPNFSKACTLVLGRTAGSLVDEWKQYLYTYPDIMTQEEIDHALKDILARHGYLTAP